jgi:hypothetical protein
MSDDRTFVIAGAGLAAAKAAETLRTEGFTGRVATTNYCSPPAPSRDDSTCPVPTWPASRTCARWMTPTHCAPPWSTELEWP